MTGADDHSDFRFFIRHNIPCAALIFKVCAKCPISFFALYATVFWLNGLCRKIGLAVSKPIRFPIAPKSCQTVNCPIAVMESKIEIDEAKVSFNSWHILV